MFHRTCSFSLQSIENLYAVFFYYCSVQKYTKDRHVKTELLKTQLFCHLRFHYIPNTQLLILACLEKDFVNLVQHLFKIKYRIMFLSIISKFKQ